LSDGDEKGIRCESGAVPVAVSSEKSFFTTMPLFAKADGKAGKVE